LKLRSSGL